MRDPARIHRILGKLRAYWLAYPDLRLGQIVSNAAGSGDPFYLPDDVLEEWLAPGAPSSRPTRADQCDKGSPEFAIECAREIADPESVEHSGKVKMAHGVLALAAERDRLRWLVDHRGEIPGVCEDCACDPHGVGRAPAPVWDGETLACPHCGADALEE